MRTLCGAPPRRRALIEWEQSVTDESADSGPSRLRPGTPAGRWRGTRMALAGVPVTKREGCEGEQDDVFGFGLASIFKFALSLTVYVPQGGN